jgi:hypothetical protein
VAGHQAAHLARRAYHALGGAAEITVGVAGGGLRARACLIENEKGEREGRDGQDGDYNK